MACPGYRRFPSISVACAACFRRRGKCRQAKGGVNANSRPHPSVFDIFLLHFKANGEGRPLVVVWYFALKICLGEIFNTI